MMPDVRAGRLTALEYAKRFDDTGLEAARLSKEHGVPVIVGVGAAVKLIESMAAVGLETSKFTTYAKPPSKAYAGALPNFIL